MKRKAEQLVLRIEPTVKKALAALSKREGVSMNTLVARLITRAVRHRHLKPRSAPERAVSGPAEIK